MFAPRVLKVSAPLLGAAAVGAVIYATRSQDEITPKLAADQPPKTGSSKDPQRIFTSGISFQDMKLQSVERINHNTKRLRFALPEEDPVTGLQPCSALLTKANPNGARLPVLRPYTPVSDGDERGHFDLLVKRYSDGKMSNHLHSMTPGQTLSFKTGPLTDYAWTPNKHSLVALITGGAGITPMYQLTRAILKNPEDKTKITLVFGINGDEDVLFKREFKEMENQFPARFKAIYTVSNPSPGSIYQKGYITRQLLESTIPGPRKENNKALFCGPPPMEAAIAGAKGYLGSQGTFGGVLKEMGYTRDQVHKL